MKKEHWWVNADGYTEGRCRVNGKWKRKKLHRRIMELHLGCELTTKDDVHHINGDRSDNRIENLMVISHSAHATLTNIQREHKRGYKVRITDAERQRRSDWMKNYNQKRGA